MSIIEKFLNRNKEKAVKALNEDYNALYEENQKLKLLVEEFEKKYKDIAENFESWYLETTNTEKPVEEPQERIWTPDEIINEKKENK